MRFILLVAVVFTGYTLAVPILNDLDTEWIKFKVQHGRQYQSLLEETERKKNFASNYATIIKHNKRYQDGLETYYMGINGFADMTFDEMQKFIGYKSVSSTKAPVERVLFKPKKEEVVPDAVDWFDKGATTRVKTQGDCKAGWAFSVTGALEAQHFIKTGKLVSLSEQNLVDCVHQNGCTAGNKDEAFQYIYENDGISSEDGYGYVAKETKCNYTVANNVTSLKAVGYIETGNENDLKAAIAQVGPVAVSIDARHMFLILGGVYYYPYCAVKNEDLNHQVLVVGYGTFRNVEYWNVKNSWGEKWGWNGYIRMSRNKNNNCGIATNASYPIMY